MKLESMIMTAQQEEGLKAFRAQQDEGFVNEEDFLKFYRMWEMEQGYFDDSNEFSNAD
jgi:hypothetical protein